MQPRTLKLAGRPLVFAHTPGHALHHHCIWDARSAGFFTGDTFGLSYREFDTARGAWLMPSTTPVQFEPEAMRHSIARMLGQCPQRLYLTHFSAVGEPARLAPTLLEQLDAMLELARSLPANEHRGPAMVEGFTEIHLASLRAHGVSLAPARVRELLALDIALNAQGMAVWLNRRHR